MAPPRPDSAPIPPAPRRSFGRFAFHAHLWSGVIGSVVLLVIAVTGIALNHKRALGLMPDVPAPPAAPLAAALPLDRLVTIALDAAPAEARGDWRPGEPAAIERIDRMDVRPRAGYAKVRFRDRATTEVTVVLATGKVLHVGARGDVFIEQLHSGEALGGAAWTLLSDGGAVVLVLALGTGYWLWLAPRRPRPARDQRGAARGER